MVAAEIQRGLADASDAPDLGPWAFLGFVLLIVGTVLGWFLQPRVRTRTGGKVFVVTVDGAEEAAAVLEGLRPTPTPGTNG